MMLTEVAQYLQSLGVATRGTDLFLAQRPDTPDRCLTLYEYPGLAPEYVQNGPHPAWEHAQLQVMARDKDYVAARELALNAWKALVQVTGAVLSGVRYLGIKPQSSPALIGRDGDDRFLVGFNASVQKDVS